MDLGYAVGNARDRVQSLNNLIHKLEEGQADAGQLNRADFADTLNYAQLILELDDSEISRKLRVSRPTISRWSRAETAPHPIAQAAVFQALTSLAREKLKAYAALVKKVRMPEISFP